MSQCILLATDGRVSAVTWPHREVSQRLGGPITFVGAIPSLNAVVVAREEGDSLDPNPFCDALVRTGCIGSECGHIRGHILVVGSDDDGEECDVDAEAVRRHLSL